MRKTTPILLLCAVALALAIGVTKPFGSKATAPDFQLVDTSGQIYAWTADC